MCLHLPILRPKWMRGMFLLAWSDPCNCLRVMEIKWILHWSKGPQVDFVCLLRRWKLWRDWKRMTTPAYFGWCRQYQLEKSSKTPASLKIAVSMPASFEAGGKIVWLHWEPFSARLLGTAPPWLTVLITPWPLPQSLQNQKAKEIHAHLKPALGLLSSSSPSPTFLFLFFISFFNYEMSIARLLICCL